MLSVRNVFTIPSLTRGTEVDTHNAGFSPRLWCRVGEEKAKPRPRSVSVWETLILPEEAPSSAHVNGLPVSACLPSLGNDEHTPAHPSVRGAASPLTSLWMTP